MHVSPNRREPQAAPFPAMLPAHGVALKMVRRCATPSDFAALSATLQLAALVRVHARPAPCGRRYVSPESWLEATNLRHLARQLDAAVAIRGRAR